MALVTPGGRGLGLNRQTYDPRDLVYDPTEDIKNLKAPTQWGPKELVHELVDDVKALFHPKSPFPAVVDLRSSPGNPPIWNQGALGSCTAFASLRAAYFTYVKDGWHNPFEGSQLFQYYNSRVLEGTQAVDNGATIRDSVRSLNLKGMCAEHWWPYSDTNPGPFNQEPPADAYTNAYKHRATKYLAIPQTLVAMPACLAAGYPFIIGIDVYASFESPQALSTGVIPLPQPGEQLLGGHALTVLGYNINEQQFIVANSWGTGVDDLGYVYLPFAYLTNTSLAYDFWSLRVQY